MDQLEDRVLVVKEGFATCSVNDCTPGTIFYDQWSTPSRDGKVVETLQTIDSVLTIANQPTLIMDYTEWLIKQELTIFDNQKLKIELIKSNFLEQKMSFDPRDDIAKRWGIE